MIESFISKYHTPGCSHYIKRAKNGIFISNANSFEHELSKCVGALQVRKYGDVFFNDKMKSLIRELAGVMSTGCVDNPTDFITECCVNQKKGRRVDLVSLKNNVRYEFESDHKICKKDDDACVVTIYI